jgi:hypothetical protein
MGSKTHDESQIETPMLRRAMSAGFGMLRSRLIGLDIDTQGSVLIERALAQAVLPRLRAGDFLIGAEINLWAVHLGVTPVEVPVVYTASGRSTVSPLRDSVAMAAGLVSLRRRLGEEQRPIRHPGEVPAS